METCASDSILSSARPQTCANGQHFSSTSLAFLLIGTFLRVGCFLFSSNYGGDAISRATYTAKWLQHKDWSLDAFGAYLPLHFWLMAIPSSLLGNVLLGTRLLSLVMGIVSLYFLWLCARELFGNIAADYSMILYAFYSLQIGYSTTSSSEVPYLFFVLAGLALYFHYKRSGKIYHLSLAGLAMTCAAAIRYEAWVLILAMVLSLLWPLPKLFRQGFYRMDELIPIVVFAVTAGIWPVSLMSHCWEKFRDPIHYLTMQKQWTAEIGSFAIHSYLYILAFHPGVLLITLSPLGIAAIVYGLWVARKGVSPIRDYYIIIVIFTSIQFYSLVSGGTWPSARYSMTLATLLAIAGGFGIRTLLLKTKVRYHSAISSVFVAALLLNLCMITVLSEISWSYTDKFRSVSPLVQFPMRIQQVSDYLKPRLGKNSAVVIDNYNCESDGIARAIDLPLLPGDRAFLAVARIHSYQCESSGGFSAQEIFSERKDLYDFIMFRRPQFVVYYQQGSLRAYLPLGGCGLFAPIERTGAKFRCVYSGQIYDIYEITY